MALRTRPTQFPELAAGVQTEQITPPAALVSYLTGFAVQPNKAIVGAQRLRPRVGHPPGRRAQEPADLRDHDPAVGRARRAARCRSASCPAGAASRASSTSWATRSRARRSTPSTARRSRWPTSRRRSPTPTWSRSSSSSKADVPRLRRARSAGASARRPAATREGNVSLVVAGEAQTAELDRQRPRRTRCSRRSTPPSQPVLGWHPVLTDYEIRAVSGGEDAQGQVLVRARRSTDEGPGALRSPATGCRPTSSRRRSRPTSSRSRSSTARRSTAIRSRSSAAGRAEDLP